MGRRDRARPDQLGALTGLLRSSLRGTKPSEIPVPSKFDFVINLKTAKALGLEIP